MTTSIDTTLTAVLDELRASKATVNNTSDDYGNPYITVIAPGPRGDAEYPVVQRHSVIGGEQIVIIDADGNMSTIPGPNGDPFGPIDDAGDEIDRLWATVVAAFPEAATGS